jgi:hypothetical protein
MSDTNHSEYIAFVRNLEDPQLALEISARRDALHRFDTLYSELRTLNSAPTDEMVEASTKARIELRLAERELARRGQPVWGVCDDGEEPEA